MFREIEKTRTTEDASRRKFLKTEAPTAPKVATDAGESVQTDAPAATVARSAPFGAMDPSRLLPADSSSELFPADLTLDDDIPAFDEPKRARLPSLSPAQSSRWNIRRASPARNTPPKETSPAPVQPPAQTVPDSTEESENAPPKSPRWWSKRRRKSETAPEQPAPPAPERPSPREEPFPVEAGGKKQPLRAIRNWGERIPGALRSLRALPRETPTVDSFALVVFSPIPLLVLGAFFGGIFAAIALLWVTVFLFVLDHLVRHPAPDAPEGAEFPAADRLSQVLAGVHFVLLAFAIWALSGGTGLGLGSWFMVFLGFGLFFGQVSNSNAHELIHRTDRRMFRLGQWVYTSLLFGHHTSAHRLVHHRFVATPGDPNSAELGEGFWSFATRAWVGSFVSGYEMELERREALVQRMIETEDPMERARLWFAAQRPYADYILGGLGFIMLFAILFGIGGVIGYLLLCAHAQLQLLLSDYVQHYGLRRKQLDIDRIAPVTTAHSWDAPHPVSALWMLNAPRHSDHHAHPGRPYPALRLGDTTGPRRPILPYSLPVMGTIALFPTLWRKVMDHRVLEVTRAGRKAA